MTISLSGADYTFTAGPTLNIVNQSGLIDAGSSIFSVDFLGSLAITTQNLGQPAGLLPTLYGVQVSETGGPAGTLNIESSAHISVDATVTGNVATGVSDNGLPMVNAGVIEVHTSTAAATGVIAGALVAFNVDQVANLGTIEVTSTSLTAIGLSIGVAPMARNAGLIDVTGQFGSIGVNLGPETDFTNSGQIVVHGDGPGLTALQAAGAPFLPMVVTNSGLIQGAEAVKVVASQGFQPVGQEMALTNSGSVIGQVDLGSGADTISNSGTMTGAINLGAGNDLYDGRLGAEAGLLQGGQGDDTLAGGNGFDNLQGNQGDDSEAGGAGDDVVVGGQGSDFQHGDDGDDVVWGNLGNDTLDGGAGADQVRGGQGDDSISGGAGNDFISGDRGNDTESGGAGADIFHGSQDAGVDRVLDFSQAEGDRVQLDPGTTYSLSQVGSDTVVDMGGGNQMILVGVTLSTLKDGWIFGA